MRAGLAIKSHYRPAVLQCLSVQRAQIDHRLQREHITLLNLWSLAGFSVVWNLRILMHAAADAMSNVIAHNGIPFGLGVRLDRESDISQMITCVTLFDCQLQALFSNTHQLQTIIA